MKAEKMTVEQGLSLGRTLPYALLRHRSTLTLGETPSEIALDTLVDGRFFSPSCEVHLFHRGGKFEAVCYSMEATDDCIVSHYPLENREFGRAITVSCEVLTDEDGQCYRGHSRLVGWEGEA